MRQLFMRLGNRSGEAITTLLNAETRNAKGLINKPPFWVNAQIIPSITVIWPTDEAYAAAWEDIPAEYRRPILLLASPDSPIGYNCPIANLANGDLGRGCHSHAIDGGALVGAETVAGYVSFEGETGAVTQVHAALHVDQLLHNTEAPMGLVWPLYGASGGITNRCVTYMIVMKEQVETLDDEEKDEP